MAAPRDYTPHQQKIIKRYYQNQPDLQQQRLAELVAELYLAEGKKRQTLWKRAAEVMEKLGVPATRIQHLVQKGDPALLAQLVKEIEGGQLRRQEIRNPNLEIRSKPA